METEKPISFGEKVGIFFFRKTSDSTQKPKRRPIKLAKLFSQVKNFVRKE